MRLQNSLTQSQEGYLGEQGIWRVEQRGEGTPWGPQGQRWGEGGTGESERTYRDELSFLLLLSLLLHRWGD